MRNQCVRSVKMYPEEWQRLEQLAVELNARPRNGLHAYQISYLALLREIANGEILLVRKKPDPDLKGLDEAISANEKTHSLRSGERQKKPAPAPMQQLDMFRA